MQWALTRLALQAARRTWLQVGGPKPVEIEAETRKNRCQKTTRFRHRFWKGSDLVLDGFLVGFLIKNAYQKRREENRPTGVLYCKKQYKIDVGTFAANGFFNQNR